MIRIINFNLFLIEIIKAFIKLTVAGLIIGILKQYDLAIALLLLLKILHVLYKNLLDSKKRNWLLLLGMLLTGFGGIIGEYWGVSNHYWEYHEITRNLPLWLPLAWMLAFYFLYRIESRIIPYLKNKNIQNKLVIAFWLSLIIPAFGEVITINMGVWTYYWPYQLFGVPLYALIFLFFLHMLIYCLLVYICKIYNINDLVFTQNTGKP